MSLIGEKIGHYHVEGELARGGMGVVYLAQDTRLDRRVAIKALSEAFAGDRDRLARFVREAKILASLNHPNIGAIYGLEERPSGERFLVLELIEGEPLSTRLLGGPLPPDEALRLAEEIAGAVGAAHERGVIHRDLKPANLMLTRSGSVKVLDFGLAKRERPSGPGPQDATTVTLDDPVTASGTVAGTVPYMSPEQLRGDPVDARSDVFSLASVIFECLTARRPFEGITLGAVVGAILTAEPAWDRLPRDLPAGLRGLLERCLSKDPARRPVNAAAVGEALSAIRSPGAAAVPEERATHHNLPAELSSFVGREIPLRECAAILESARMLTITGIGGGGKTRLALRVARRCLERYGDGTWLVELGQVSDPGRVPHAVAATLGLSESGETPIDSIVEEHLRAKRALLLLDGCEDLIAGCAPFVQRLLASAPDVRILATSRAPLGLEGERVYPVPPLSLERDSAPDGPESVQPSEAERLFAERAVLVAPEFSMTKQDLPQVREICRQVDGIPLAIELAAARMRVLSLSELQARLADRFKLLTRHASFLARQQTLRTTIQWSYEHLSEREQRLLRRMSVFAGGWTLRAATAVSSDALDEFAVLDLLTMLAEKALVLTDRHDRSESRFRMLETVREFAREQLVARAEERDALDRHLRYYVAWAEEAAGRIAGAADETWAASIDIERENFLAAHAACDGLAEGGERGLRLLWAVRLYWGYRGLVSLGLGQNRIALDRPGADAPTSWRSELLFTTAWLSYFRGLYAEAEVLAEESLAICRAREDMRGTANALAWLGAVSVARGRLAVARQRLDEAVSLARDPQNGRILAPALHNYGSLKLLENDVEGAAVLFEEALALSRADDRLEGVAVNLLALTRVDILRGRRDAARGHLVEGLRLAGRNSLWVRGQALLDEAVALAVGSASPAVAARLWGATEAMRREMNLTREPTDEAFVSPYVERARVELGAPAFAAEEAAGAALSRPEALAAALGWLEQRAALPHD